MTRFVVDAQLPPGLARLLDAKGYPAEHVHNLALGSATDDAIWEYALKTGSAVISKDEDFANRIALHPDGPAIVWLRIGNTSNKALLAWFVPILPSIIKALSKGEKLIEIL